MTSYIVFKYEIDASESHSITLKVFSSFSSEVAFCTVDARAMDYLPKRCSGLIVLYSLKGRLDKHSEGEKRDLLD